jgi:hypothetical protein
MGGKPPPWDLVLPCSGNRFKCLQADTVATLESECGDDRSCLLSRAAAWVGKNRNNSLFTAASSLNGCFAEGVWKFSPNARDAYQAGEAAMAASGAACGTHKCCQNRAEFGSAVCNNGKAWAASGAGVVMVSGRDQETNFNQIKLHTEYLWHHGHGRLIDEEKCEARGGPPSTRHLFFRM